MWLNACRADAWRRWWRHAFAVAAPVEPDEADRDLARRLARHVVRRGLTAPALMALESGRPRRFVGSQALAFLGPFATLVLPAADYERLVRLLEQRAGIDVLITALQEEGSGPHE